jgi:hypothetical protein
MWKAIVLPICLVSICACLLATTRGRELNGANDINKTNVHSRHAELRLEWCQYLQALSIFGKLDSLELKGRAQKVRALVAKTREVIPMGVILASSDRDEQIEDARLLASALWLGVRLESNRVLLCQSPKERTTAANSALRYLRELRNCLRDFPPACLEKDNGKGDERIRYWHRAMAEFDSYETDARAEAGVQSDVYDDEDPRTRAALWVLRIYGPYNENESTDNARLMQDTSKEFREVERLAKMAVAIRVQASVALSKIYGSSAKKDWFVKGVDGKDMTVSEDFLAPPEIEGCSAGERDAFRIEEKRLPNLDKPVYVIDEDLVKLIRLTASGDLDAVLQKYARTRAALKWNAEEFRNRSLMVGAGKGEDNHELLFGDLKKKFDRHNLWSSGAAPNVWAVQKGLQAWITTNAGRHDVPFLWPNIPAPIPAYIPESLADWPEKRAELKRAWEKVRQVTLTDRRLSKGARPAAPALEYSSLAGFRLLELREQTSRFRLSLEGNRGQPSTTGVDANGFLRDGDFGRLNLPVPSTGADALGEHSPEEMRLNLFRAKLGIVYEKEAKPSKEKNALDSAVVIRMSERIADYFILRWTIIERYKCGSEPITFPLWATGFLARMEARIKETLKAASQDRQKELSRASRGEKGQ